MADTETIPAAKGSVMGDNQPATPFDALKAHIDDLDLEARNHLDGEPIKTEAQATAVSKLLDDARKAKSAADDARKAEAKPFDEGKAAVQAQWKPLIDRAELVSTTAKNALATFLTSQEQAQRAAAEALRKEAEEAAEAAAQTSASVDPTDLAGMATARIRHERAADLAKRAERAEKQRPQAKGGERAVGLRSVWSASLSDPVAALRHYRERQPDDLKAWLRGQAQRDVSAGQRAIPGFTITESKVAV